MRAFLCCLILGCSGGAGSGAGPAPVPDGGPDAPDALLDGTPPSEDGAPPDVVLDGDAANPPGPNVPTLLAPPNGFSTGSIHSATGGGINALRPIFRWTSVDADSFEIALSDRCSPTAFTACEDFDTPVATTEPRYQSGTVLAVRTEAPVGSRYFWRVRACDAVACSAWSEVRYLEVGRQSTDVNGDGFADLLVGAPGQTTATGETGALFLCPGATGPTPVPDCAVVENSETREGLRLGSGVALGDLNGDGFADVAVAAPADHATLGDGRGEVHVYFGQASGLPAAPVVILSGPDDSGFGSDLAVVGDVDGDGAADLLVAVPNAAGMFDGEGKAFLFWGGTTLSASMTMVLDNPAVGTVTGFGTAVGGGEDFNGDGNAELAVSDDDGRVFVYLGGRRGLADPDVTLNQAGNFGADITVVRDYGDDGLGDLVIGAPGWNLPADDHGTVFLYEGNRETGLVSPPLNIALLLPMDPDIRFGASVANAGDVNGTGNSDLIIGAPMDDGETGSVHLHRGPLGVGAPLDAPGMVAGDRFGFSVAGIGDLNGDGLADVAAGAPGHGDGRVLFYPGNPSEGPSVILDAPLASGTATEFGFAIGR